LVDVPLAFALAGLVFYTVLGGADFGAGFWELAARGRGADEDRRHAHRAIGPVWEANHVWLVFVLTVVWTAYPIVFSSITSTLAVPLLIALIGIIVRGAAYALRSVEHERFARGLLVLFASASIVAPLMLGMSVGAIAALRVPPGNAAGSPISSWVNASSAAIGLLAVAAAAYLAAVFLAADARRQGNAPLEERFRQRALGAGVVGGIVALAALGALSIDARHVFDGVTAGRGLPALVVSLVAGATTLVLVWRRRYEASRYTAAAAVAAVIAGWALAQLPHVLRGLTLQQAAAPYDTLVSVTVAIVAGGAIVFPCLALLFRLVLTGRFDRPPLPEQPSAAAVVVFRRGLLGRAAFACFVVGFGLTNVANGALLHAIGVSALLLTVVLGLPAAVPELRRVGPSP
jgi:cytochrome bd ubiquinol oxidase subunit II